MVGPGSADAPRRPAAAQPGVHAGDGACGPRDDGPPQFHRTPPRAAFDAANGAMVIGVPGGRAWGIVSELPPLPPAGIVLIVRLTVSDDAVREAFVHIAYYGCASTRTRQAATADSAPVAARRRAPAAIALEPAAGGGGVSGARARSPCRSDRPLGRRCRHRDAAVGAARRSSDRLRWSPG